MTEATDCRPKQGADVLDATNAERIMLLGERNVTVRSVLKTLPKFCAQNFNSENAGHAADGSCASNSGSDQQSAIEGCDEKRSADETASCLADEECGGGADAVGSDGANEVTPIGDGGGALAACPDVQPLLDG